MGPCWLLVVTRGLRVWLPPEVYLNHDLAVREVARWRATLRLPKAPPEFSATARCLHLLQTQFPESWHACPIWVGVTWSVKKYPRLRVELMAADEKEAAVWLRRRAPIRGIIGGGTEAEFQRRGVLTGVGAVRVKRVMGF